MQYSAGTPINYILDSFTGFLTFKQFIEEVENKEQIQIQIINDRVLRICKDEEEFFAEVMRIDYFGKILTLMVLNEAEVANKYRIISLYDDDKILVINKNGDKPSDGELAKLRLLGIIRSEVI